MQNKKEKLPDEKLGKFCIIAGSIMVILPFFLSRMDWGQKFPALIGGFGGISWGLQQVVAAKKRRQQYGEPTPEEQMEVKKSHSVSWPIWALVAIIILGIVFAALVGAKHEH